MKVTAVTVTAIEDFEHGRLNVERGQLLRMAPVEALVAARQGRVSLTVGARVVPRDQRAQPPQPERPMRRPGKKRKKEPARADTSRQYRRRDLVPEE